MQSELYEKTRTDLLNSDKELQSLSERFSITAGAEQGTQEQLDAALHKIRELEEEVEAKVQQVGSQLKEELDVTRALYEECRQQLGAFRSKV